MSSGSRLATLMDLIDLIKLLRVEVAKSPTPVLQDQLQRLRLDCMLGKPMSGSTRPWFAPYLKYVKFT